MSLLLTIDTAVENASICLAENDTLIKLSVSAVQKEHASWIHRAIRELFTDTGYRLEDLSAIAVSNGPGSYTGLRVGLSTAKGICYALKKPLITIGTLEMMANATPKIPQQLICPMIDARRMEVFFALYTDALEVLKKPGSAILDKSFLAEELNQKSIVFIGNGAAKFQPFCTSANALFSQTTANAGHLIAPALKSFQEGKFADLAYAEPFYLKDFFSGSR